MPSVRPIYSRLFARIAGNALSTASATEVIELSSAIERQHPPAISLSNEFDRVIDFQQDTTKAQELDRLRPGLHLHGATVAYGIHDAVLADGTLYFQGGYENVRSCKKRLILPSKAERFDEMMLCSNYVIERYF